MEKVNTYMSALEKEEITKLTETIGLLRYKKASIMNAVRQRRYRDLERKRNPKRTREERYALDDNGTCNGTPGYISAEKKAYITQSTPNIKVAAYSITSNLEFVQDGIPSTPAEQTQVEDKMEGLAEAAISCLEFA